MADFESIVKKYAGEDGAIPAEAVSKLIQAVSSTVGREFVEKKRYNDKLEEIETLKGEKQTAEDSATTATKWKTRHDELKIEFDKYKGEVAAKETAAANERLFRAELTAVGITGKRADQIVKLTDMTQFETENGAYKDAKAVQDHIRAEYSEFVPTTHTNGAVVPTPPQNNGGKMTKEDIAKIKDTAARQAAMVDNFELYAN